MKSISAYLLKDEPYAKLEILLILDFELVELLHQLVKLLRRQLVEDGSGLLGQVFPGVCRLRRGLVRRGLD